MTEVWLPVIVPGFEDYYEASSFGQVQSLNRVVHTTNQSGPCVKNLKGKILRPSPNSGGYPTVVLRAEGKSKTVGVHVLVCGAFNGEAPQPGMDAVHWDDVKTNNDATNLFWATRSQNMQDKVRNGRHSQANQTECLRGHEFTDENTHRMKAGGRMCRQCHRDYYREYMRKKRVSNGI